MYSSAELSKDINAPADVSEFDATSKLAQYGKFLISNPNVFVLDLSLLKLNTPMSFVFPGVGSFCPSFKVEEPSFININRQGKPLIVSLVSVIFLPF